MLRPDDIVRHKPTGEGWLVIGVSGDGSEVIPERHPFPTIAKASDCELANRGDGIQREEWADDLLRHGLGRFVKR